MCYNGIWILLFYLFESVYIVSAVECYQCQTNHEDCTTNTCTNSNGCKTTIRFQNGIINYQKECKEITACQNDVTSNNQNSCKSLSSSFGNPVCMYCCDTPLCNIDVDAGSTQKTGEFALANGVQALVYKDTRTYTEASDFCTSWGGQLFVPRYTTDINTITALLGSSAFNMHNDRLFTALGYNNGIYNYLQGAENNVDISEISPVTSPPGVDGHYLIGKPSPQLNFETTSTTTSHFFICERNGDPIGGGTGNSVDSTSTQEPIITVMSELTTTVTEPVTPTAAAITTTNLPTTASNPTTIPATTTTTTTTTTAIDDGIPSTIAAETTTDNALTTTNYRFSSTYSQTLIATDSNPSTTVDQSSRVHISTPPGDRTLSSDSITNSQSPSAMTSRANSFTTLVATQRDTVHGIYSSAPDDQLSSSYSSKHIEDITVDKVTSLPNIVQTAFLSTHIPVSSGGYSLDWNEWTPWTVCTNDCGGGTRFRLVLCSNITGYDNCTRVLTTPYNYDLGYGVKVGLCNIKACPVDGRWLDWTSWNRCNVDCLEGIQRRDRTCWGPYYRGNPCTGDSYQWQNCFVNETCPKVDPKPPAKEAAWTKSDDRPSAIAIGTIGIVVCVIEIVLVLVLDSSALIRDIRRLKKNVIKCFDKRVMKTKVTDIS